MTPEKKHRLVAFYPKIIAAALLVALALSVCYAFYTGFRAPNVWSAGYYQFSWLDGFYRRGLMGTLLYPFGCERYNYHFIKLIEWGILAALLGAILYIGLRAKATLFLCLYFTSAAGGFLFHEVGYIEQFLWLLAGISLYLIHKNYWLAASIILAIALLIHEMALFILFPLIIAYLLIYQSMTLQLLVKLFSLPAAICILLFLFQKTGSEAITLHMRLASECGYPVVRLDFLEIFTNSFMNRAGNRYIRNPFLGEKIVLHILFLVLLAVFVAHTLLRKSPRILLARLLLIVCCVCPLLLGFLAWDTNRWLFISFTQILFILLIYFCADSSPTLVMALSKRIVIIPFVMTALIVNYQYFDGFKPRTWSTDNLMSFRGYIMQQIESASNDVQ